MAQVTVVTAERLIDGTGAAAIEGAALVVEAGRITRVGRAADGVPEGEHVARIDLGNRTLLPGLINVHAHFCLPGDGSDLEPVMQLSDELLLLTAAENARTSLYSGVTTLRDCGGKGTLTFRLREAIERGTVEGPTLVLCGRPLTITGGHCWYFGGETDGAEAMRQASRQLLKEGADFIKIMANGGGTRGTYPQFPSYSLEELRAAVEVAHGVGKPVATHCNATATIHRALDAEVDGIEHASCLNPDGSIEFSPATADRIARQGVFVTPTLRVASDPYEALRAATPEPTPAQRAAFAVAEERIARRTAVIAGHYRHGVRLVAGDDAGWRATRFDVFWKEIVNHAAIGQTPMEAIVSATGWAAELLRIDRQRGTLRAGLAADVLAVDGDPLADLTTLGRPALIMKDGRAIVQPETGRITSR